MSGLYLKKAFDMRNRKMSYSIFNLPLNKNKQTTDFVTIAEKSENFNLLK